MYQASTIESVALTRCALTLAQLGALVPVIKRCARLRGVDVSDNRLGESRDAADWERLAEMVEVRETANRIRMIQTSFVVLVMD